MKSLKSASEPSICKTRETCRKCHLAHYMGMVKEGLKERVDESNETSYYDHFRVKSEGEKAETVLNVAGDIYYDSLRVKSEVLKTSLEASSLGCENKPQVTFNMKSVFLHLEWALMCINCAYFSDVLSFNSKFAKIDLNFQLIILQF